MDPGARIISLYMKINTARIVFISFATTSGRLPESLDGGDHPSPTASFFV